MASPSVKNRHDFRSEWGVQSLQRCAPELFALLQMALCGKAPVEAFLVSLALRLAWVASELMHGLAHSVMRGLVDAEPSVICLENVLEHRSPWQMLRALLPLAPIGLMGEGQRPMPWLHAGDPEPWKLRLKAGAGIFSHLAVLAITLPLWLQSTTANPSDVGLSLPNNLLLGIVLSNICLALASRTDLQSLVSGSGSILYCGNFGLVAGPQAIRGRELLSPRVISLFHRMGRETELRGAQAGGGLVMTLDRQGENRLVGHKIVNAKRGDLTPALEDGFRRRRRRAHRGGCRPHSDATVACWHYRFGTSGPPAVRETHWQEWTPGRRCRLWHPGEDGRWEWRWQRVHHRITHNGDFEAFEDFGALLPVATDLGTWLAETLQQPAPALVDSARIAGMMDLLICQGDWFAAVRWGCLQTLSPFPQVPPAEDLERWARLFEETFLDLEARTDLGPPLRVDSDPGPSRHRWTRIYRKAMLQQLRLEPQLASHSEESLRTWIQMALDGFLQNSPATALKYFMDRARGSFGLVVASTTWPDRLVVGSLGQPITIGGNPAEGMVLYASESAAIDAVLAGQEQGWRIDLDENAGEIAILSADDLNIFSLSLDRQLSPQEVLNRRHPYAPWAEAPEVAPSSPHNPSTDPVAADIAEIPSLLAAITDDWSNPGSRNRQSADALAQLLITKAANLADKENVLRQAGLDDSLAKSHHVDLLITGVENSLWLAEQFARDLSLLMPRLRVKALSANAVLMAIQHDMERLALARQSIVLVLSHSCRTFPSRQVMEACDLMARRGVIRDLFILTGEPGSLRGSSMLAARQPGESIVSRLFTTGAGRRRAEPATAAVAAMHQTLTQLLFCLSRQLLQAFPDERQRPLGLSLSRDELALLDNLESNLFLQECGVILGTDGLGRHRPTATSRELKQGGRTWALHVLETPIAWAIHATYILISVSFGLPLMQSLLKGVSVAFAVPSAADPGGPCAALALVADVALYIFGPWLWSLGLRFCQGRSLLARTGRRSLVIGEVPCNHQLLTNYISKLFSLSYGIASLAVQGAEVGDHLLHTHAHRLVRGSLLFLGVPDGRCSSLMRAEADAAMLTARQADGIRHFDTGPEIVAVGTEPSIQVGPFRRAIVLPCAVHEGCADGRLGPSSHVIDILRESRFGAFRRLLAGYVFFWAMAQTVGCLPLLRFKWWRSQSRTRVMTTAAPVSAAKLDLIEPKEIAALSLDALAHREQS
ncbi:MAG: hypothetical protein ACKOOC_05205 [Cyanobium sp.]